MFYIIATTFTRITYFSFAVSLVVFGFGYYAGKGRSFFPAFLSWKNTIVCLVMISGFFLVLSRTYSQGGYVSLLAALFALVMPAFIGIFSTKMKKGWVFTSLAVILGFASYQMANSSIISKWNPTGSYDAFMESILLCMVLLLAGCFFGKMFAEQKRSRHYLVVLVVPVLVITLCVPVLSGYRMQERFSDSVQDADTRFNHWEDSLEAMDDGWLHRFLGMGLGTFPKVFFQKKAWARDTGRYEYKNENGDKFLRLYGGSDMELGQRLLPDRLDANSRYKVIIKARSRPETPSVRVRVCHRNLMHAAGCRNYKANLVKRDEKWSYYEAGIEKGALKPYKWYAQWPKVFLIRNKRKQTVIDLYQVAVINNAGKNIIDNSAFKKGGARWFSYNEFEHLPWHAKSMFLHLFFEQGYTGLFLFLAMVLSVLATSVKNIMKGDLYALSLVTAMTGFLAVGITGTLIDAPRVTFLFYLILFAASLRSDKGNVTKVYG